MTAMALHTALETATVVVQSKELENSYFAYPYNVLYVRVEPQYAFEH